METGERALEPSAQQTPIVARQPGWTGYLVFCNFGIVLGSSLAYGYNLGVVNAPFAVMNAYLNESFIREGNFLTAEQLSMRWSLFVTLYIIGGFVGSVWFPGALARALGKRNALLLCAAIGILGEVTLFVTPWTESYIPLMVGRAVLGFQGGLAMTIAPGLITEQAPDRLRGSCGSIFAIGAPSGVILSNLLGLWFALGTAHYWHCLFFVAAGLYLIHGVAVIFVVESPTYLIDTKKDDDAVEALIKLRNTTEEDARLEVDEIKRLARRESAVQTVSISSVFKHRQFWWPLILVVNLHIVNQLTGLGAAFFYSTKVMKEAGLDGDTAALANFGISFVTIIGNSLNIAFVDRIGRRFFMLLGLCGIICGHVVLIIALTYNIFQGTIAGFAIFLFSYAIGPGSIPYFMTAEMFSQPARPLAFAVGMFTSWAGSILVSFGFPVLQLHLGQYCFLPFASIACFEFFLFLLFLPETSSLIVDFDSDRFAPGRSLLQLRHPPKRRRNLPPQQNNDATTANLTNESNVM